jgi:tRNA threonylcarbamoyladenosine biosynthesis protein TsaE
VAEVNLTVATPEAMNDLGRRVGGVLTAGDVVVLSGDLGAGKTAFVRGFVRGLGCGSRAHSPTFALVHEYRGGRLPIQHLDLYRLGSAEDLHSAGLDACLNPIDAVSVIEWFSRIDSLAPFLPSLHRISLRWVDESTREITHDLPGL